MSARSRRQGILVGLVLVVGGTLIAIVRFAPCAFATSRNSTEGILAEAERWLEVVGPVADVRGALSNGQGNATVPLHVRHIRVGGVSTSEPIVEDVAIHEELLREVRRAVGGGSRVFLALAGQGSVREEVAYGVVHRTNETYEFFAGCDIDLTSEVHGLLGARYDAVVPQLIGLTGHDDIYRLLADVEPAPGHLLVVWTKSGPDLRMFSRTGRLIERGECLAVKTEVGPLVPILDAGYYLATDREALVLMSGLDRVVRVGDRVELAGRELSPDEAVSYAERRSIRRCPGRLILTNGISRVFGAA